MDDTARWRSLYNRKLEFEATVAFQFFKDNGLEPILIKGWAAARNYPSGVPRFYTDIDLAFSKEEYDIARALLTTQKSKKIGADLHRELRLLDTKPWRQLFTDSLEVNLGETKIRVPSYEDHLRIMAVHWLTDGGAYKEKLWDIYYAVQNRPASFQWDRCLNCVSEIRREWVVAAVGLAHRYLKLDIEELPFAEQAKDLPSWLVSAVEHEWKSDVRLQSLIVNLHNPKRFFLQVKKRIPPNPIQATIEMEGRFDNSPRLGYQIRSAAKRCVPFFRLLTTRLKSRN